MPLQHIRYHYNSNTTIVCRSAFFLSIVFSFKFVQAIVTHIKYEIKLRRIRRTRGRRKTRNLMNEIITDSASVRIILLTASKSNSLLIFVHKQ